MESRQLGMRNGQADARQEEQSNLARKTKFQTSTGANRNRKKFRCFYFPYFLPYSERSVTIPATIHVYILVHQYFLLLYWFGRENESERKVDRKANDPPRIENRFVFY